MAKRPPTIPDSELDVLKVLWDRDQATVREALETLRAAGRQWSYATVATLLDRLESKGLVRSKEIAPEGEKGRPRKQYRVTPQGARALALTHEAAARMWDGVEVPGL
jgi:predicted transcriptional regulator